jgi:hypothetical protein
VGTIEGKTAARRSRQLPPAAAGLAVPSRIESFVDWFKSYFIMQQDLVDARAWGTMHMIPLFWRLSN